LGDGFPFTDDELPLELDPPPLPPLIFAPVSEFEEDPDLGPFPSDEPFKSPRSSFPIFATFERTLSAAEIS